MQVSSGSPPRLRSLDGLRGIAAAIVVLHHISLTVPSISDAYDSAENMTPFSIEWWAVASPLKVLLAGPEFVLVFFVLSGFVLTLSPVKGRVQRGVPVDRYDWAAYFPRRVLRLGIPVVAAMILAIAVNTLLPHPTASDDGDFLLRQAHPTMSPRNIITQTLLIVNPSRPSINPPMWSLTWEMWFSLLLPLAVLVALWSLRAPLVWMIALTALTIGGYLLHIDAASFLPAFFLGAILAANAGRIRRFIDTRTSRVAVNIAGTVITVLGSQLLISFWLLRPVLGPDASRIALSMRVVGAVILVAVAAFWPAAGWFFSRAPFVWLGKISFSLYLVHSPFVIAFGLIFNGPLWWVGALSSLTVSVVFTLVMYRFVEYPAQLLARRGGERFSARMHRLAKKTTPPAG